MKASQEHYKIGVALAEALEPLIDICLDCGISSPEFERLIRVAFVSRAFEKLPKHPKSGRPPTVNKVSMATGIDWQDVSKIHDAGAAPAAKELMGKGAVSKGSRVLKGWMTDPLFMTTGGQPLDLPIKRMRGRKSFKDLVAKYASSTHAGSLMKEMQRQGQLQIVDEDIVRFKSAMSMKVGLNPTAIAEASRKVKRLGATVYQNLQADTSSGIYEETASFSLTQEQIALLKPRLERRVRTFLRSLEAEFRNRDEGEKSPRSESFGVSAYSWKK